MKEKKRKGIRGKDKGREFELRIAKRLSEWSSIIWRRVPLSGGWDTSIVSGDVFCVAEYDPTYVGPRIHIPVSIELKCDESWDFIQLFKDTDKCPLRTFWKQATDDAKVTKKIPMLVFTQNWVPELVMLRRSTLDRLAKLNGESWETLKYFIYPMSSTEIVVILLLESLLSWIDYPTFLKLSE